MNFFDMDYAKSVQKVFHHYTMFDYYKNSNPVKAKHHYDQYSAAMKKYVLDYGEREEEIEKEDNERAIYNTIESQLPYGHSQTISAPGRVRLFHSAKSIGPVDIYANDQLLFSNFKYKQLTQYVDLPAGLYQVKITEANRPESVLISKNIQIIPSITFTIAAIETDNGIEFLSWVDSTDIENDEAKVRFIHLGYKAPNVDIGVIGGDVVFFNVPFKSMSDYLVVSPINLGIEVKNSNTKEPLLQAPSITLEGNTAYTIVAIGQNTKEHPLELVVLTYKDM